jgi:hypothetical protein
MATPERVKRLKSEQDVSEVIDLIRDVEKRMIEFANKYITLMDMSEKNSVYNVLMDVSSLEISCQTLLEDIHYTNMES